MALHSCMGSEIRIFSGFESNMHETHSCDRFYLVPAFTQFGEPEPVSNQKPEFQWSGLPNSFPDCQFQPWMIHCIQPSGWILWMDPYTVQSSCHLPVLSPVFIWADKLQGWDDPGFDQSGRCQGESCKLSGTANQEGDHRQRGRLRQGDSQVLGWQESVAL